MEKEYDNVELAEIAEFLENNGYEVIKEDFSMGVGAPMGLDQGIPHGGDCKGCYAQRMGLYQRSPFSKNPLYDGVPDAHHPDYWLHQIPKKKRKKLRRKRKHVNENRITDFLNRNKQVINPIKRIYDTAINLVKSQLLPIDSDAVAKFTNAYHDALRYDTLPVYNDETLNNDATLQSDDAAHIFGRYVGHLCSKHEFSTFKDLFELINDLKSKINILAKQ